MDSKVSIIVPAYNVAPYIEECLRSALDQDYPDIEVVLVDDGSQDKLLPIVQTISDPNGRLKVISQQNQGPSAARNAGIAAATGDWLLFLDGDDYLRLDAVSGCMTELRARQAEIAFFEAEAFSDGVSADGFHYRRPPQLAHVCLSASEYLCRAIEESAFIVQPCLYIFSRKVLGKTRFKPGILHEDNLFLVQLLTQADCRVCTIPEAYFLRRVRPGSITTQRQSERHIKGYLSVLKGILALWQTLPAESREALALRAFCRITLINGARSAAGTYGLQVPWRYRLEIIQLIKQQGLRFWSAPRVIFALLPELFVKQVMLAWRQTR